MFLCVPCSQQKLDQTQEQAMYASVRLSQWTGGGRSGNGATSPRTSLFPLSASFHQRSILILRRRYMIFATDSVVKRISLFFIYLFCWKIHPVVAHHNKTDIRLAFSHNKWYQSRQYLLHVSVVLNIIRHLNTRF
jgi:hypothetical protein